MRKIITLALMALCGFIKGYAFDYALYEDWGMCADGSLPEGWSTVGTDKTPAGYASSCFEYGEGMKVMTLPDAGGIYAVSYSSTLEGGKVDTRLISPAFKTPACGGILSFEAVNYNPGGTVANKIEVYVVGPDGRENSVFMTRIPSNNVKSPSQCNVPLDKYADSEISIIIANEGTDAGLLGIGTVSVSEYVGEIYDYTPIFSPREENRKFEMAVGMLAPCKGFKAELTTSTGIEETFSSTRDLSEGYAVYPLSFKKSFNLAMGEVMDYTVRVIPNMEGATPLVMTGSTGCGEGFPAVCVEEEGTGEKCGYCPAGSAGIEKFSAEYGDRFIGIGIHCTEVFSTGVMEAPGYADEYVKNPRFPVESLPTALLNRKLRQSPTMFEEIDDAVRNVIDEPSVAETEIESVAYNKDNGEVKVCFSTRLSLPFESVGINAAVVLLADSLTGSDIKWWQYNYYSNTSKESLVSDAGESWWPYMQFYCDYPSQLISPTDMSYNHVAMGIYPDFYGDGCPLKSNWSDGEPEKTEISFLMPMQEEVNGFGVQNPDNTSVVVLVFDRRTGEIIAADKMKASLYNISGIDSVEDCSEPVEVYYISVNGIKSENPPVGVSVKVSIHSDGHITSEKIYKK